MHTGDTQYQGLVYIKNFSTFMHIPVYQCKISKKILLSSRNHCIECICMRIYSLIKMFFSEIWEKELEIFSVYRTEEEKET